jgi:hypothetical protein
MGQITPGDAGSAVGPPPVAVPPVPPPTEAQAVASVTANANPSALTNDFMISPFAATSADLLNGFDYDRDSLAAADACSAKSVSLSLGTQRMQ